MTREKYQPQIRIGEGQPETHGGWGFWPDVAGLGRVPSGPVEWSMLQARGFPNLTLQTPASHLALRAQQCAKALPWTDIDIWVSIHQQHYLQFIITCTFIDQFL